jgi:hypothetical protein
LGDVLKLRLNEWQALGSGSGRGTNDWIEIYNPETNAVALAGLILNDSTVPAPPGDAIRDLSFIAPQGFVQILLVDNANDADELEHFSLRSSGTVGDHIYMFAPGALIFFDDVPTSPVPPVQANETEGRVPDGGDLIIHFKNSTPGNSNFGPIPEVVFSEVLTHTDPPLEDAIELLNTTNLAVNIGDWWISNDRNNPKKFRIPADTILPPGGRVVFYEWAGVFGMPGFNTSGNWQQSGFYPQFSSWWIDLPVQGRHEWEPDRFPARERFRSLANSVSFGRHVTSEGKSDLVAMSGRSFGMDNPRLSRNSAREPACPILIRSSDQSWSTKSIIIHQTTSFRVSPMTTAALNLLNCATSPASRCFFTIPTFIAMRTASFFRLGPSMPTGEPTRGGCVGKWTLTSR